MDNSEKNSLKRKHNSSTSRQSNEETEDKLAKRRKSVLKDDGPKELVGQSSLTLMNDVLEQHKVTSIGQKKKPPQLANNLPCDLEENQSQKSLKLALDDISPNSSKTFLAQTKKPTSKNEGTPKTCYPVEKTLQKSLNLNSEAGFSKILPSTEQKLKETSTKTKKYSGKSDKPLNIFYLDEENQQKRIRLDSASNLETDSSKTLPSIGHKVKGKSTKTKKFTGQSDKPLNTCDLDEDNQSKSIILGSADNLEGCSSKTFTSIAQKVQETSTKTKKYSGESDKPLNISDLDEENQSKSILLGSADNLEGCSSKTLPSIEQKVKEKSTKTKKFAGQSKPLNTCNLDEENQQKSILLDSANNVEAFSSKTLPSVDQKVRKNTGGNNELSGLHELKEENHRKGSNCGDGLGDVGASVGPKMKQESKQIVEAPIGGKTLPPNVFGKDIKVCDDAESNDASNLVHESETNEEDVVTYELHRRGKGRPRKTDKFPNPIWAKVVANFTGASSENSVVKIMNPGKKEARPPKRKKVEVEEILSGSSDSEDQKPNRRALPKRGEKCGRKRKPRKAPDKLVTTHKSRTDEVNQIQITMSTTQLKDDMKPVEVSKNKSDIIKNFFDAGKMTYRVMKRANFVIETVRQEKVIVDLTKLMRAIRDEEMGEGYNATIDKKSLMRLILKLSRDGHIKFRKATLKSNSKEKCVCFICDPNIEDDHSVITSALEQSKMKFFIGTKDKKNQHNIIEEKDLPFKSKDIVKTIVLEECGNQTEKKIIMSYKYDRNASKAYGLCPKFVRTRLMHELIFYLIYEQNTQQPITEREEVEKLFLELGIKEEVLENDRYCTVYNRELNWKMFIPPLPVHNGWPLGWTLICDILLRLPMVTFLKCFNVPYVIPDVHYYLDHPVRKYFLVKNLPPKIRNGLMHGRKYIFSMHEIATRLCHMGLVQFGPQKLKEKDQIFLYLNRKASLLNTVKSPPGYHQVGEMEYEKMEYTFNSAHDVDTYWYELWSICINTRLGTRLSVTGQYIILESATTKPDLMATVKPKAALEAAPLDTGEIPGDKRGAAGLDSALFAHLKRNWNWSDLLNYPGKQGKSQPSRFLGKSEPEEPIKKIDVTVKPIEKPKRFKVKKKELPRKKIVRHVLPKKQPKGKQPLYDEKDKICLKKRSKLRSDWTQIEDNVLLLCTVASIYLCPNRRRQNVEYTVMRDVLHRIVPSAQEKTSRSCQRRINYIMKNIKTRRSVHMCLEELRQCENVIEKFGAITKNGGLVIPVLTLNIGFIELVGYLNRRFSNQIPTRNKPIAPLPDTIQEVRAAYDVIANSKKASTHFKDVETINDVHFDVIRSVIHSSMCCTKDKTSWAFQLFKIYQQYPESLLRSVIRQIRHDQMVSVKKAYMKSSAFSSGCLPFSYPFQLSISYAYQLQNTRFHYEYYNESNAFLKSVLSWLEDYALHKLNDHLELTHSDDGTTILLQNIMETLNIEFKFDHPDQVIVLDPVITNDTAYERIVSRYNEILKDPAQINYWEEAKNEDDEENFPDFANNDRLKHMDLNSAMIRKSSTRIAFHMMRAEMCEGVDKNSAQHIHDYFVVNASRVFLKIPEKERNWENYTLNKLQENGNVLKVLEKIKSNACVPLICGRITSDSVKSFFPSKQLSNYDFEYIEKLKCTIWSSKELGSTISNLSQVLPDSSKTQLTILDVLSLLQSQKVVFRVGVSIPRFVHFDHKGPWIVNSDKIVRLEREKMDRDLSTKWKGKRLIKALPEDGKEHQKIKILAAPWIRLDGSLNRRVLDRWFGSILSYCIEEPGISLRDLSSRYDYLKPVEVLSVVENLSDLRCVRLIKMHKPKVSLFSTEPDFGYEIANILDDPKKVLIEPTEDAIFKFAVFVGEKKYGSNFID